MQFIFIQAFLIFHSALHTPPDIHIHISICTHQHTCTFSSISKHRPSGAHKLSQGLVIMHPLLLACWLLSLGIDSMPLFPFCDTLPGIPVCKTISKECPSFSEGLLLFATFHAIPRLLRGPRPDLREYWFVVEKQKYIFPLFMREFSCSAYLFPFTIFFFKTVEKCVRAIRQKKRAERRRE